VECRRGGITAAHDGVLRQFTKFPLPTRQPDLDKSFPLWRIRLKLDENRLKLICADMALLEN
jgi:hypothetical protein